MNFQNEAHEKRYYDILNRMKTRDCYHKSAAYLMALRIMCPEDIFDFDEDIILHSGLHEPWQTHSTRKATRLMFNLWNGWVRDEGNFDVPVSPYYAVDEIFCNAEWAPYFYEAIRIRFEWI